MSTNGRIKALAADYGARLFEPLLNLATPELYERVAFRLLELPVEASERELNRRREVMERAMRNRLAPPAGAARILPRTHPPDEHEVREAGHALQDAERRLAHELFWFWPRALGGVATDVALDQLAQGNIAQAGKLWSEPGWSSARPVARHNRALLHHLAALDLERELLDGGAEGPEAARRQTQAEVHWREAAKCWAGIAADEVFWSRVSARIRALDDRSLSTGAVRRLQATLPVALTLIDVRLALRALERTGPGSAQRHVTRIRSSALPAEGVEEGLRRAVEPLRALLKSQCQGIEAEAQKNPSDADQVVQRLLDQTAPELAKLDLLLPEAHPARQAEHDQVALAALRCQIVFGNQTHNHKRCVELIERILPIAASAGARDEIARDRAIDIRNLEQSLCWFCGQEQSDDACAVEVPMYGEVQDLGNRVKWSHLKVRVGRCQVCARETYSEPARSIATAFLAVVGGCLFFIGVLFTLAPGSKGPLLVWAVILGFISSSVTRVPLDKFLRRKSARANLTKRSRDDFPTIKELKSQGWAIGEKPPGVQ